MDGIAAHRCFFLFCITLKPRVERYKSLCALNRALLHARWTCHAPCTGHWAHSPPILGRCVEGYLAQKKKPPLNHHRALGVVLLYGPRGFFILYEPGIPVWRRHLRLPGVCFAAAAWSSLSRPEVDRCVPRIECVNIRRRSLGNLSQPE